MLVTARGVLRGPGRHVGGSDTRGHEVAAARNTPVPALSGQARRHALHVVPLSAAEITLQRLMLALRVDFHPDAAAAAEDVRKELVCAVPVVERPPPVLQPSHAGLAVPPHFGPAIRARR